MKTLLVCSCVVLLAGCGQVEEAPPPEAVVQVTVTSAAVSSVVLTTRAPASIYPREQASVASKVTAPIDGLLVKTGDTVAAGQLIARLANRDLVAQRVEALDRARADTASAEAVLAQAQKDLERRQVLYSQGAITARELLATQTAATQAKASYDVAQKYLDLLNASAPREVAAGDTEEGGQTAFLNAQLEFTEIRSPLAGVVTQQFLYPGDMAKPDSPIFTLMDLSVAVARAQVPERDIAGVARGQACSFESGDSPGQRYNGRISVVSQAMDPARRTIEVWCDIPNPRRTLRAGVFGSVTVSVGRAENAIVLPVSAVQFQEGTTSGTAVVVDQERVAHLRDVEAVPVPEGKVRVIHGIEAGETVVIEGGYGLPDGTSVTFAESTQ